MLDDFSALALSQRVAGTIFEGKIHHVREVDSTNTLAMRSAGEGAPEGTVYIADSQTAGRGRGDHRWLSAPGEGIHLSAILRPAIPSERVPLISLLAGLTVGETLSSLDESLAIDLKWPNDVLAGGRKICGILTESSGDSTAVRQVVVGIGINLNQSEFPGEIALTATSMRMQTGRIWKRLDVCAALLKSLNHEYAEFQKNPAGKSIVRRFEAASSIVKGCRINVEEDGRYSGMTEGLDERGFLRVRTAEGERTVYSGTIRRA